MVVLKKISGSTLMETLVATVLIVVIFMIVSMTLNTIFYNTIRGRTLDINTHLSELQYNYWHGNVTVPYQDEFYDWDIHIYKLDKNTNECTVFEAVNHKLNKNITQTVYDY